jgi:membrane-bound lytic murein transglycosylase MltF
VGTNYGNQLKRHYFDQSGFAKNAIDTDGRARFGTLSSIFKKYGEQYEFDYLLLMAQGYQESGLNQNARSQVGAIGVMQVMPATGKELHVGNIHQTDPNIHAGTKYIHMMRDKYFNSPEIDPVNQMYFSFAAYNAGPGNVIKMRKLAKKQGFDPDVWFDNVELMMLQHIGREPVQYVSNISKYYLAYKLLDRHKVVVPQASKPPLK